MWVWGVDACGYIGGRDGGTHPLEIFWAEIANFECFIDISRLNEHKNFRGLCPHPQGATSPLKFFFDFWTRECLHILRRAHPCIRERFRRRAPPNKCLRCRFRFRDTDTKLTHDGPRTCLHPRCAQGQGRGQRSRDMGTFVISQKWLLVKGKLLYRHQSCTRWYLYRPASWVRSRSRSRTKVT